MEAKRPCPHDLDTPSLGPERGNPLRNEVDAGRHGVLSIPFHQGWEDDVRFAHSGGRRDLVAQRPRIRAAMALRRLHERLPQACFLNGIATDHNRPVVGADFPHLSGTQPPFRARVGDLHPGARIDGRNVPATAPAVFAGLVEDHFLLAAVEHQDRFRRHAGSLLHAMEPGDRRLLSHPRERAGYRLHRRARNCRRLGKPGRHPRRHLRLGDAHLAGGGIDKERPRKREKDQGRTSAARAARRCSPASPTSQKSSHRLGGVHDNATPWMS